MSGPTPLTAYQQTYHWRNKNCSTFAQEWIKSNLPGVKVDDGKQSAEISEVTSVSGDCDLGQRKGKLLTIYDLEVESSWTGKDSNGEEVKGTLKVPEVSHEAIDGLSDYVFEFRLTSTGTPEAQALLQYLRQSFPSPLKEKFNAFRPALIAAHGQPSSEAPSGASTPNPAVGQSSSYAPAPPTKSASDADARSEKAPASGSKVNNVATVEVKATLQASADDIWGLLTDEKRIPMWSRSAAKMNLSPGSPFELFGGNVVGKVESVDAPKKLVQSWQARSPSWPSDHFGTLTTTLNQGSNSTDLVFTLDGVPSGQESDVERALNGFYLQGLKSMGLVLSTSSRSFRTPKSSTTTAKSRKKRRQPSSQASSWLSSTVIGGVALVGLSAVLVGLVMSSIKQSPTLGTML